MEYAVIRAAIPSTRYRRSSTAEFPRNDRNSSSLSGELSFVGVDLYSINQRIVFGEMTFYPENGKGVFAPRQWGARLGEFLSLPGNKPKQTSVG
ncbi:MAG: hypothetical protein GF344_10925 [Chitinivibrionales bacterium]|nr:hypothetical protein [Chitinivibrionales bacterium]MBD3357316.1 hypothetical protein [Chitinivibrionales bacterium]